jgi:putative exporter of polyketide antibiotics
MFVVEFVFAFVISMLCAAMLLPVTARSGWRVRHPSIEPLSVFALLLILFLATWAGGIWLVPLGPRLWGVAWGGFVVVGLFVALLIGAVSKVDGTLNVPYGSRPRGPEASMMALALLVLLILAVVAGYARHR